jgi:hypothetical protein
MSPPVSAMITSAARRCTLRQALEGRFDSEHALVVGQILAHKWLRGTLIGKRRSGRPRKGSRKEPPLDQRDFLFRDDTQAPCVAPSGLSLRPGKAGANISLTRTPRVRPSQEPDRRRAGACFCLDAVASAALTPRVARTVIARSKRESSAQARFMRMHSPPGALEPRLASR